MSLLQSSLSNQKPPARSNTMDTMAETTSHRDSSPSLVDEAILPVGHNEGHMSFHHKQDSCRSIITPDKWTDGVTETRPTFAELKSIERHRREILLRVS